MGKIIIIISTILITLVLLTIIIVLSNSNTTSSKDIVNFEQCVASGGRIQESFPARCITDDGKSFTQSIE